jgi:hypothetical protein
VWPIIVCSFQTEEGECAMGNAMVIRVTEVEGLGAGFLIALDVSDLLYPQYDGQLVESVQHVADVIYNAATKLLASDQGAPEVRQRWQDIVDGKLLTREFLTQVFLGNKLKK